MNASWYHGPFQFLLVIQVLWIVKHILSCHPLLKFHVSCIMICFMDPKNVPTGSPLYESSLYLYLLWAVELIDIARWTSPGFLLLNPSIAGVSWAPVDRTTTTTRAPVPLELAGAESLRFGHGQDLGMSVNETVILLFIIFIFLYDIYIYIYLFIYIIYILYMIWCMLCIASIFRFLLFVWMYRYLRVLCRINNCEIIKV